MREARGARARPAVDAERLGRVRAEVGEQAVRRYARAYLDLLWPRIERIEQAMAAAEAGEARRIMFDLRVSSEMLGVAELPGMIAELESSPQTWLAAGTARLRRERREAKRVEDELPPLLGLLGV
ncbi:hypothetical protein [Actinospica robiniae]|uniref:hypothetical protein n=1 Tax=Actinospica robiniae TaxID=304901 RepID=UPI00054D9586|nr:hypothetical protein [Actinospica robiniae]